MSALLSHRKLNSNFDLQFLHLSALGNRWDCGGTLGAMLTSQKWKIKGFWQSPRKHCFSLGNIDMFVFFFLNEIHLERAK